MWKVRWRVLGPPALGFAALQLLLGGSIGASGQGSATKDGTGSRAQGRGPTGVEECRAEYSDAARAWYQLDEQTDSRGALTGYTLRHGLLGVRARGSRQLPPESFVAGPFGGALVYGLDDGAASEVHLLDTSSGCETVVARSAHLVRRASLDPARTHLYYHLRERRTRGDLGVWRHKLGNVGLGEQILPALGDAPRRSRFGPTFSTEFAWSADGSALAVQSCAAFECRTRVVEPATGLTSTYDAPGQGELLAVTGGHLVTYAACAGLPCPVQAIDRRSGRARVLVGAAGAAIVVQDRDQHLLVYESAASGHGYEVAALNVVSGGARVVHRAPSAELRLLPRPSRALAAASLAPGWVLLSPEGRLTASGSPSAQLVRLSDGARAQLEGASQ